MGSGLAKSKLLLVVIVLGIIFLSLGINDAQAVSLLYRATLGQTGTFGTDNAHFHTPYSVGVDQSGNVYVVDTNNYRIQKFNAAGVYQLTLGTAGVSGSDAYHFNQPTGVAIDSSGNIYVADYNNA